MNFVYLQDNVKAWADRNFPRSHMGYHALLGVVEEVGELSHAHLKQLQGIRGTPEEHEAAGKDAVGDILIYLADYCEQRGWSMDQIARETLDTVMKRDWKKNKKDGVVE